MPYSEPVEVRDDILCVRHSGPTTRRQAESLRCQAGELARKRDIRRVLMDVHEAALQLSTMDLYDFNSSHTVHYLPGTRMALILSPDQLKAMGADFDLARTVAANTGLSLRTFTDLTEAVAYLRD